MSKKPVLLVDQDECLADFWGPICDQCGKTKEDITTWETPSWARKAFNEAMSYGHYINLKPIPGSLEAIRALSDYWDIFVVTYIPPASFNSNIFDAKRQWLVNKGFNDHIEGVISTDHKAQVIGDVLIDDRLYNCEQFKKTGRTAIVFDRPWNRDVPSDLMLNRAQDWEEVQDHLFNYLQVFNAAQDAGNKETKPDFTQLDAEFLHHMAVVGAKGREKHPEQLRHDCPETSNMRSLLGHVNEYQRGQTDDDDGWGVPQEAKIAFRAMMAYEIRMHNERQEKLKRQAAFEKLCAEDDPEEEMVEFRPQPKPIDDLLCIICGHDHKNEVCW